MVPYSWQATVVEVAPDGGGLVHSGNVRRASLVPPFGLRDRRETSSRGPTLGLGACLQLARLLDRASFALSAQLLAQPSAHPRRIGAVAALAPVAAIPRTEIEAAPTEGKKRPSGETQSLRYEVNTSDHGLSLTPTLSVTVSVRRCAARYVLKMPPANSDSELVSDLRLHIEYTGYIQKNPAFHLHSHTKPHINCADSHDYGKYALRQA